MLGDRGRPPPIENPYSLRLEGGSLGGSLGGGGNWSRGTCGEDRLLLVLEGLYSWWLQKRLVYSPLVSGDAEQPRQRIQTISLQWLKSSGHAHLS